MISVFVQIAAVFIATLVAYGLSVALKERFETCFRSPLTRSAGQWLMLWCSYLILPLFFSASGMGLFLASNSQIYLAVIQLHTEKQALDVNLDWATILLGGATLISFLSIAMSRLFVVLFSAEGLASTVFFAGMAGASVLAIIGFLERRYFELLLEKIFGLGFLSEFLVLGTGLFLVVEGLIYMISQSPRLRPLQGD